MINVKGEKADDKVVHCFNAHDNLFNAVQVTQLADKLGIKLVIKDDGLQWVSFLYQGKNLTNVAFYQPSHAYAFLLGVAAGREPL
jgi:hypothetical protein